MRHTLMAVGEQSDPCCAVGVRFKSVMLIFSIAGKKKDTFKDFRDMYW